MAKGQEARGRKRASGEGEKTSQTTKGLSNDHLCRAPVRKIPQPRFQSGAGGLDVVLPLFQPQKNPSSSLVLHTSIWTLELCLVRPKPNPSHHPDPTTRQSNFSQVCFHLKGRGARGELKCSTNSVVEFKMALKKQSAGDKAGGGGCIETGVRVMFKGVGSGRGTGQNQSRPGSKQANRHQRHSG